MEPNQQPARRFPRWMYAFIPTKDVAVTPILISLNILVWIAMVATGVSPYAPDIEDVMNWGASNTDAVVGGEYWRLWTSNYLHYGFLHLGVNMLSLHNVGRLLERFIGKWRFGLLYTFTGIFASAVSIWWHPYSVGVGASGAILGIVGVLTALLTTNLIDKSVRWQMLRSIGFSILLMLIIGLNAGIDNAAHFGGLFSGAIGGYLIYPELKSFYYEAKKIFWGLIASLFIIAGGIGWLILMAEPGRGPNDLFAAIQWNELSADKKYEENSYSNSHDVSQNVLPHYEQSLKQLDSLEEIGLNEQGVALVNQHRNYIKARIKYYQYISESLDTKDPVYNDSIEIWRAQSTKLKPIIIVDTGEE